jgi:mono/diheme cytochrome c family protein
VASDHLPARGVVMADEAGSDQSAVFTRDLFNLFRSYCGGCHVDGDRGGLHVNLDNFPMVITQQALNRILSDDPSFYMPPSGPGSSPFSKRAPGDPIIEFASLLEQWLAAGSPADRFYLAARATTTAKSPYLMSKGVGMALTNLGNCVPDKALVGTETDHSAKLDAFFEAATELPDKLEDTDLTTFDSATLAREGIIGFAPAYTLWADNAKKMRAVRVPRGKSIVFDKNTQTLAIPPNTRFYKTFLKRVIDADGNERYRKVETRLIVSRPDTVASNGEHEIRALFGTYAWNDSETEALLVRDPLRNGQPFRDRLLTVITDEPGAKKVVDSAPKNVDDALRQAGVTRTYAIPGSERCKDCHMGSDNDSFVLGFVPLQLHRRPMGEGGVIEPADRDELAQLQRLIDYGVISGMASPDDVVLLEDSEGERKPRNQQELDAQGYMLGNCAHCHNPTGDPSVENPELRDVLNFRPSDVGGIFQFPLDKMSPRIHRGQGQDEPIPYITPMVIDHVPADTTNYRRKIFITATDKLAEDGVTRVPVNAESTVFAPWRSLIYRNVDAPFSYAEDFAIFPHMPRNTPGYDCRTRRLLGSWMVSIPAVWDNPGKLAAAEQFNDTRPQPYLEVKPGEAGYDSAKHDSMYRLSLFEQSVRYQDCPDPPLDIVDPDVVSGHTVVPIPLSRVWENPDKTMSQMSLLVPGHPHWAVTDLSDAPGDWAPRRSDWQDVLIHKQGLEGDSKLRQRVAVDLLQSVSLTDEVRSFALGEVPFGLWTPKTGCDLSGMPKASDFTGDSRPRWMDAPGSGINDGSERVYAISPGAQVFTIICSNCHGAQADSHGRIADTIADMTGGETRVANLRDGILGPLDHPGQNRQRVFGIAATGSITADDWAARYALWMGLGGTQRIIPPAALTIVGNTLVLGRKRPGFAAPPGANANMLTVAQSLCGNVLPSRDWDFDGTTGRLPLKYNSSAKPALIAENGDWELWEKLCTLDNPLPVRVVSVNAWYDKDTMQPFDKNALLDSLRIVGTGSGASGLYRREGYPASTPVADDRGHVLPALSADVRAPWCLLKPTAAADLTVAQQFVQDAGLGGQPLPFCPDALLATDPTDGHALYQLMAADVDRWTTRAAMNAGLSVFLYLDALERGNKPAVVRYDQCEKLSH